MIRIAIIGAGVAGLTAALRLRAVGYNPIVFEKSRGIGGRVATRRVGDDLTFDHGAQYLTARSDAFISIIEDAVGRGAAARWRPRASGPDGGDAPEFFVGAPTMNAFLKAAVADAGIDVRLKTELASVKPDSGAWRISDNDGHVNAEFDAVICTAPPPQARALYAADPDLVAQIDRVRVRPCWTLMAHFGTEIDAGFDTWRDSDGDIVWLARNNTKPGRPRSGDQWVAQAGPGWSEAHLEWDREDVAAILLSKVMPMIGQSVPPQYGAAHRWRYALTDVPLGKPFAASSTGLALLGGDWALGARIECAFESGLAMADAVERAMRA